eukprot:TRINITY_DN1214_c0_g1_i1.p1 TRINITY_DN1214_c0_g1~~TRINITY_DN1214_c0_g1_i1.p1  ORF type:complete len:309 (-),score=68.37 TRINITY_DN1214_c0_g1_i1:82-1008(-)
MGARNAKDDMRFYRDGYPGQADNASLTDNIEFYRNAKPIPKGELIDNIHANWKGNYDLIDSSRRIFKWLFPIREPCRYNLSQPLQKHEITFFKSDQQCRERVIKSVDMIFDFFGLTLNFTHSGDPVVERSENWIERYKFLNANFRNNMRITRMLKFLVETGFEKIAVAFLDHIVTEMFQNKLFPNCQESFGDYWIEAIKENHPRTRLDNLAYRLRSSYSSQGQNWDEISNNTVYYSQSSTSQTKRSNISDLNDSTTDEDDEDGDGDGDEDKSRLGNIVHQAMMEDSDDNEACAQEDDDDDPPAGAGSP